MSNISRDRQIPKQKRIKLDLTSMERTGGGNTTDRSNSRIGKGLMNLLAAEHNIVPI